MEYTKDLVTIKKDGCRQFNIKKSMHRYALLENYLQQKENDKSKKITMYIDRRLKETWNIVGFINSTHTGSTNK